jgi:hypothetical protein
VTATEDKRRAEMAAIENFMLITNKKSNNTQNKKREKEKRKKRWMFVFYIGQSINNKLILAPCYTLSNL